MSAAETASHGVAQALTLADQLPALQVVVPLFASLLCALIRQSFLAWLIALAATWSSAVIAVVLVLQVYDGGTISYAMGGWAPPWGIEYRVDRLSAFVLFLVAGVSAVMMPFALRSVASEVDDERRPWFYTMYLLCLAGLLGITITGDAFNAFVFLEISSLSTYTLIALGRDRRALLSAYQYLIMGTLGASFYVLGVGFIYTLTGSLNLVDIGNRLDEIGFIPPVLAGLAFITIGISLKLALFPLHAWLPGAYANAPSFVTAFLAATATKVAVYLLVRYLFFVFAIGEAFDDLPVFEILLALSIAAMFGASIVAVFQEDIKRMLAYSSVAQIGYITLGIALANHAGLTGGLVHLMNHAVTKAALFIAVGAVVFRVGTNKIEELAGLGRQMPITMAVFVLAGLSIIGVPGTAGFISKWQLAIGALDKDWWWLVVLVMASSLIAVVYIGRIVEIVWFRAPVVTVAEARRPPASMMLSMLALALGVVYFGFETTWSNGLASGAAELILGEPE